MDENSRELTKIENVNRKRRKTPAELQIDDEN